MKITKEATTEAISDAGRQAMEATREARKQALEATREARKQARRRMVGARIAAARAQEKARSRGSGPGTKAVGAAGAIGLAAGYFLDPDSGRRRRHLARDRALALVRRSADRTRREAEYRAGQVEGKIEGDQALAERVKSEIFQPADAPKASVNVNVERGVVYLRGEVKRPDEIRKLVEQAGSVDGVAGVENLMHTP